MDQETHNLREITDKWRGRKEGNKDMHGRQKWPGHVGGPRQASTEMGKCE